MLPSNACSAFGYITALIFDRGTPNSCKMSGREDARAPARKRPATLPPPKKKARMLKANECKLISENTVLQLNDAEALCKVVRSRIDAGLDLQSFLDRQAFWRSIKDTEEL